MKYHRNHYFGLGPKQKPKLADTITDTKNTFQRENLAKIVWGIFFLILKGNFKPNLLTYIQDFPIDFEDLYLISSFQKPTSPFKKQKNMRKFEKF